MPFLYQTVKACVLYKRVICNVLLLFNWFVISTAISYAVVSNTQSFLEVYDTSNITYINNNDNLHIGTKQAGSIFYPIFATIGSQQAAVKFLAVKSMQINGIYIEADVYGSHSRFNLPLKQSAFMLESAYSVKLSNGIIVAPSVNIFGGNDSNSEQSGIVVALPLISNITNHGNIQGNYGILFKNNGYLDGSIINFGKIIANNVIGSTNNNINTTNNTSLVNNLGGYIQGNISLEGAINSIDNYGLITGTNTATFIAKGINSTINNSGNISLYNIIPATTKNYLSINNTGYIYTEKNLVANNLFNKSKLTTNSLAVLNEATNSGHITVNELLLAGSIKLNNSTFNLTASKFTNLKTGVVSINKTLLALTDNIIHNQGIIDSKQSITLLGTLTNYGGLIANNLLANNYQTLIIDKSATSIFYNIGDNNSNINIINYGSLTLTSNTQEATREAIIAGNIFIHKNNKCMQDGVINLANNITQIAGSFNTGRVTVNADTDLTIADEASFICNDKILAAKLNINNDGILQLNPDSKLASYDSNSGTLTIQLNTNSLAQNIPYKIPLLSCDNLFHISHAAKIKIIPPKQITKNISTKLYTVYSPRVSVDGLALYKGNYVEKTINGNNELYLTQMNIENDYLTGRIVIKSLIGYHPDSKYAKQQVFVSDLSSMGIAWTYNKINNKPLSNNLIFSPNTLAMEDGWLSFNNTDFTIGSSTATFKFACNTKDSLPALLIGTTVVTDDNFIATATTSILNINSISLFNINADGRNEIGEHNNKRNQDAIAINGIHSLQLNSAKNKNGLLLDSSMIIKAGATSCGLNIAAPITGNITNNTTIGDSLTGTAIGIHNYFDGMITNNGTLDAVNYAIYIQPKKYGKSSVADFVVNNLNYINGSIYFNTNKRSSNSIIYLNNCKQITANTITNMGNAPLYITNYQGKISTIEISASTIENHDAMDIKSKLFSNKNCDFLNKTSGIARIINLSVDRHLINDGKLFLISLFSNNSTLTNNNIVNVGSITDIDIINNNTFNIYKCIAGKVTATSNNISRNALTIDDIVTTIKGTQLTTEGIGFTNKGKLINSQGATIHINKLHSLSINNNVDNYGSIIVDNTIYLHSDCINNGMLAANTITSSNNSCIYNNSSLFCNNLGSSKTKLEIIGNINIANSASNTNIAGEINLHADNLRQKNGELLLGNSLQQITVNGEVSLGGFGQISSVPKPLDLVINNNSVTKFALPLTINNLSVINSGTVEFMQGSEIANYSSNLGWLNLVISDVNNISKNGLLHILNSATFDASSIINLKYADVKNYNFTKQSITVTNCNSLYNSQSLNKLVNSIKVGSILLTVTNTQVANNSIITDISLTDFAIINPNITTAKHLLYNTILGAITGKAWAINKTQGKLSTNNLIISPPSLLEVNDLISYDSSNQSLIIRSNSIPAQIISSIKVAGKDSPPLIIGTTVLTDASFTIVNNSKLDFNSIFIDNIIINGSSYQAFNADTDGVAITGNSPIEMLNNGSLSIGYGATITAGKTGSALRISPSFTGNIINHGVIGSNNSKYGITLDNFLSGSINNENKIVANDTAVKLNIIKNQNNRNFTINNNGQFIGSIIIAATNITDNFTVIINNDKLISSSTITSNKKVYTVLNNNNGGEVSINYFNINKINNKGKLNLLALEYKISDKILHNYGSIYAKKIIIDDNLTNDGNIYITDLSGINFSKQIINNGLIITDEIENITIYGTGTLKLKNKINGNVLVNCPINMDGDITINSLSSITLESLIGAKYKLTNQGQATINKLIVNTLLNQKNSRLIIQDKLELNSASKNFGTINAKNLLIKSGTFTNQKKAKLTLANDKYFIIGSHNFINKGELSAKKIIVEKNFINNGKISTVDLITDATQIVNNQRCSLSWQNIKAHNKLDIINQGDLVFSYSQASVITGTITIHKDYNKKQDGKLKILGTPHIYNSLTVGELEGSGSNTINIEASGKLSLTMPFIQKQTSIENSGEISLCSGSDIQNYYAKSGSSIYFKIIDPKTTWFNADLIRFHDGALMYVTLEKSLSIGSNNNVKIITSTSKLANTHESGINAPLNTKMIKERILYLENYNRILYLSNIEITDRNKNIMADVHILDSSKITNNMIYADQTLIPSSLGYYLAANNNELVGVAWKINFYKSSNNPQSNNLIVSPVTLLQDNQLKFDFNKRILTIGLSKYKINPAKNQPAIVIGDDVNPGGIFVTKEKASSSLLLDSIHINDISITTATKDLAIAGPTFQDAILITGNNNIKLVNPLGLVLGTNTNITSNSEACLNFATTFLGNITNFAIINATADTQAIKINQFFDGTITNKNTIKSKNTAIYVHADHAKENFRDVKTDNLLHFNIVNEGTIVGDILVYIQRKYDDTTFYSLVNKKHISANKVDITGNIAATITNTKSAALTIGSLTGYFRKIDNYGYVEIAKITNHFHINDKNFNNLGTAKLGSCFFEGTLTNKQSLYVTDLNNLGNNTIYNNKDLQIKNIYNEHNNNLNILNSDFLSINGNCSKGNINVTGTLTVTETLKSVNKSNITCDKLELKGSIINGHGCTIKINSNLFVNNNFINYGVLTAHGDIYLLDNFNNQGSIVVNRIIGNNNFITIAKNKELICSKIGEYNDALEIINEGTIIIKSLTTDDAELYGDITIKDKQDPLFSNFTISSSVNYNNGILLAKSFNSIAKSTITIGAKAMMIFTDNVQEKVNINNHGLLELAHNSKLNSYSSNNGTLCINITSLASTTNTSLLLIEDIATFNNKSQIQLKYLGHNIPYQNTGATVDIMHAKKGLFKKSSKLEKLTTSDIINNITASQMDSKIILVIDNIRINNNVITAHISLHDISSLHGIMQPASQKLVENPQKLEVYGLAWKQNKTHNNLTSNNLIISPNNIALDSSIIRFSTITNVLQIGSYNNIKNIFAVDSEAALIIGNDIILDSYFTEENNNPVQLAKINIDNIVVDGSIYNFDYSKVNKDGVLINGQNGFVVTDRFIIGKQARIVAGASASALNIATEIKSKIINDGIIGDHVTGFGIYLRNAIRGSLTNNGIINGNIAALKYDEYNVNNNISFSIFNYGTITGNLIFNSNKIKQDTTAIDFYNYKTIIANEISATALTNINIYNEKNATILADAINIKLLQNEGYIKITGTKSFVIKNDNFINNNTVIANNILLADNINNDANLQSDNLDGNYKTITNKSYLQVGNIKNTHIENLANLNINGDIYGNVTINGSVTLGKNTIINKDTTLTASSIYGYLMLENYGNLHINQDAHLDVLKNQENAKLTTNANLILNGYSENYGTIIADNIQCDNYKLSNLDNGYIRIKGNKGFVIYANSFENANKLIVDNSLILKSNFTTDGKISAANLQGNNINFTINKDAQVQLKNISNDNNTINIINKGKLIIDTNELASSIIAGNITVVKDTDMSANADIAIEHDVIQQSGVLHAGAILSNNDITYSISNNAISIFNNKFDAQINFINKGILSLEDNCNIKEYNSDDGILIITLKGSIASNNLLEADDHIYLTKNSKIIINQTEQSAKSDRKLIRPAILSAKKGIIYKDFNYKNYNFEKMFFAAPTNSILLKISNIIATTNKIYADISQLNTTNINKMSNADKILTKKLTEEYQERDISVRTEKDQQNLVSSIEDDSSSDEEILEDIATIIKDEENRETNSKAEVILEDETIIAENDNSWKAQVTSTGNAVRWENTEADETKIVTREIEVQPLEIYTEDAALNLASGVEIAHQDSKTRKHRNVVINFIEEVLSDNDIAGKYLQHLLNPMIYSKYPDLATLFLSWKNEGTESIPKVVANLALPSLHSVGKVYRDAESTITIRDKINIRKAKTTTNKQDAVLITGSLDKISSLKVINITEESKLITYATASALHIAIPSHANINNTGIIGDKKTGCGLKITQPLSSTITNDNLIAGKTALELNINNNLAVISPKICINNQGVIYGSVITNTTKKSQVMELNNFNVIIANTITGKNNHSINIYNHQDALIAANYVKSNNLQNYGLMKVDTIYSCKYTVNEGTINVYNNLLLENQLINNGIISAERILGKPHSHIVNNNKIFTRKLENIEIDNKNNAIVAVKDSIIGRVTITGKLYIASNVLQKDMLTVDQLLSQNNYCCFTVQDNSICNIKSQLASPKLHIKNFGTIHAPQSPTLNRYTANGGTLFIDIPHNFKNINRSLLLVENTASFNTYKGKASKILLSAYLPRGYNPQSLINDNKSLIKIITSKKILFNGHSATHEMDDVLYVKSVSSNSIFIRISDPYISKENDKEVLYAFVNWQNINDALEINKYPISVKRLARLMQDSQVYTDKQDIINTITIGINNKRLPKEAKDVVTYLLQEQNHANIYQELIANIQEKFESCLYQDKNDLISVASSLIPDTPIIEVNLDTNIAGNTFATVNNHFLKSRLQKNYATGINSSSYYSSIPLWYSISFMQNKEYNAILCNYNKWSSHLLNAGVDDRLTKDITFGLIASYAKVAITPIYNKYNSHIHDLTSLQASCYLQYTSNLLQTNLVFMLANNFHQGEHHYNITNKEYNNKYTTKLYGCMLELAYPYRYKNLSIDLTTAIKVFSANVPKYNLGVYVKHANMNTKKTACSIGISIAQEFYLASDFAINYAFTTIYAYNFILGNNAISANILGKNFTFKINSQDNHQLTLSASAGVNYKSRLNINCNVISNIQNDKNSLGITLTTKYLF